MNYLFTERQRFNQWWLWLIILSMNGFFIFIKVKAIIEGQSNPGKWIALVVIVLITLVLLLSNLKTRISKEGIEVRFFPFHFSFIKISWDQLSKVEVREYSPLGEYGGWGLRYGRSGKAYNVSGKIGIQLTYKDGSTLLIGTNKREEVENVLKQIHPLTAVGV